MSKSVWGPLSIPGPVLGTFSDAGERRGVAEWQQFVPVRLRAATDS
jgi:hypothetical protein